MSASGAVEDGLDSAVTRVVEGQGASAGGLDALGAVALGEPDNPLSGPQVVEHAIGKELCDERVTGGADAPALGQTPVRVPHDIGQRLGQQMVVDGMPTAGSPQSGVGRDEFVVAEDLRGRLGGLQPQVLAHEPERHGVLTLLELHVGVAMGLDLRPHGGLRRTIRQPLQQVPFGLFQSRQWPLVGAAVDALTGFAEYPGAQLPVVIAQIAKLPQRHEALLDVLDARLDAALRPKAHGPSAWVPPSCR